LLAARQGKFDVVELLIVNGADVNAQNMMYEEVVPIVLPPGRMLVDWKGATIELPPQIFICGEETALHYAAEKNHKRIVDFLISKGADVNTKNASSVTPLICAAYYGSADSIESLLLSRRIDLNAKDYDERTALHRAAERGHLDIVKLLFDKGADLVAKDNRGWTPYKVAKKSGNKEVAKILKKAMKTVKAN